MAFFRNARTAFNPPKPNEFERAYSQGVFLGRLGITSNSHSGSGSMKLAVGTERLTGVSGFALSMLVESAWKAHALGAHFDCFADASLNLLHGFFYVFGNRSVFRIGHNTGRS